MKFKTLMFLLFCFTIILFAQKNNSGPIISAHSDPYFKNGKWYCPLCRQVIKHGDRSKIDPKLILSEWHDVYLDKNYFNNKIRYISDEELINSLDIPELNKSLKSYLKDENKISEILFKYFSSRNDNNRLFCYDSQNRRYFIQIDEFINDIKKDKSREERIIKSANDFYSTDKGYSIYGVNFGKKIDFNHSYQQTSKWGVHYLNFIEDQINYFLITKDTTIPKIFEDAFNQWYEQIDGIEIEKAPNHKVLYDVVWYELGLSVRTNRLIDAFRVFGKYMNPETNKRMLKIILGSSRWLFECLSKTPFHPYNWQTFTSIALSYVSCIFPEFKESNLWYEKSRKNMELHITKDIFDDGGYVERTPSYADGMFATYYRYMMMLKYFKNDDSFQKKYLNRIEKFVEFFVLTNTPIGVVAPFNDARRTKNIISVFKEMAEFFNRGDFLGGVKNNFTDEELSKLKVVPKEPIVKSVDFPISKFAVMRQSWDPLSYFMIINYGGFENHCHYDHLDFEIYANGIPIALDAGIGKYGYIDTLHSKWYKHPLSHNMITINQAVPEKIDMSGYDKIWVTQNLTDFFAATHNGYLKYQKTKHRRNIVFVKNKYWLILDEIFTKEKDKDIDFNFHTPSYMEEIKTGFISKENNGFLLLFDKNDLPNITKIHDKGMADLTDLPNEKENREIDWLIFRKKSIGNYIDDRIATIILPFKNKDEINYNDYYIEKIDLLDKFAKGYHIKTQYGEDIIIISDGKNRQFTKDIKGDFTFCYISFQDNIPKYISMSNVSEFNIYDTFKNKFNMRKNYELDK